MLTCVRESSVWARTRARPGQHVYRLAGGIAGAQAQTRVLSVLGLPYLGARAFIEAAAAMHPEALVEAGSFVVLLETAKAELIKTI